MADVKWIKIVTDIFDDEKIKLIESMPDSDGLLVIWFKILCLAGRSNSGGFLMINDKIVYTDEMLSTIFNRSINLIRFALSTFESFEMIEITDNGYYVMNWEKHQNIDGLEKIKEQNRIRQKNYRDKHNALQIEDNNVISNVTDNVTSRSCNGTEEELDKDKDKEKKNLINSVIEHYKTNCSMLPKFEKITDARKKAINARIVDYGVEGVMATLDKANISKFLTDKKDANGKVKKWLTFDWIFNPNNFVKIYEGNYEGQKVVDREAYQKTLVRKEV